MKNIFNIIALLCFYQNLSAQCTPDVPTYVVDLSANPDTTWILYEANAPVRAGQCCGVSTNENCIIFEVTLHPDVAGVYFDFDGSNAYGSLNWRINCGTPYNLRDTTCVNETGPFTLTFCKPGGGNGGNYTIMSVPKPTFPDDQIVSLNCIQPLEILGVNANSPTWQSISPGTPGQYNSYLSCTNCLTPVFTPNPSAPSEIQYQVCGYPILDYCVGYYNYCDTVKITILDSLLLSVTPNPASFCTGGNVTLTAQATGGDGNYNFYWYNGSMQLIGTGLTYVADTYGSYTCEVRDGDYEPGFCDDFFESVTVIESLTPSISVSGNQVLCATTPNASITGSYQNATGILWSGGSGTFQNGNDELSNIYVPSVTDIENGNVTLTLSTVGAGSGCENTSAQLQLFFIDTVQTNLADISLLCKNDIVTVNPVISGGTTPYTYSWTNGASTSNNTLNEGVHCLTISDATGCQVTECITVSAPPTIDLSTSSTSATTNGGSDGTATVNVSGGVTPYTYLWSNGGTTATITGLSYGVYSVTVTDANGCSQTTSIVVTEPLCDGFSITTSFTDVACFDGTNGQASATVSGGTGPFTYQWNDPAAQTTAMASNLVSGVYSVQVTDGVGCIIIGTVSINEPDQLTNTIVHTNVSILGGSDGQAQANVSGGLGVYTYSWSNGSTTEWITNLTSGWYFVEITDGNNCSLMDSVFISEPPCEEFYTMLSTTSPLCYGLSTGTASLSLVNGQAPYAISWSTGQTDVLSISGISAGFYTVQVTDARGCQITQNYGISQPSQLTVGLNPSPGQCFGSNDGTIDASITGGIYPYSYTWSTGSQTQDLINLASGTYSLLVTDNNGCQDFETTVITEPQMLTATYTKQNVNCNGFSNGSIDVEVSGGTSPYSYLWSDGATTQDLNAIDAGGYILVITDANGCSPAMNLTVFITEPEVLTANPIIISEYNGYGVSCHGMQNGEINVQVNGGTIPYSFNWSNGGTTANIPNLSSGVYTVSVTDVNGCTTNAIAEIIQPDSLFVGLISENVSCNGGNDGSIDASIAGGVEPYTYTWNNGVQTQDLINFVSGTYSLMVNDNNGCQVFATSVLTEPQMLTATHIQQNISCNGYSDGSIDVEVSGGVSPYSYFWSDGATTQDVGGVDAGEYILTITDANGCSPTMNLTVLITEPEVLIANPIITSNYNGYGVSCYGMDNGEINAMVNGGTMPYSFNWSNGENTSNIPNLSSGVYTVSVTDVNGCSTSAFAEILQPDSLFVGLSPENVSCNGGNDGWIDVTVSGGVEPYTYNWSNGESTQDLTTLSEGEYTLTVTDVNNCSYLAEQVVIHPTDLSIVPSSTSVTCYNFADGFIELSCEGGTSPYTYQWSNGASTEDIDNLASGTYDVVVTDVNGCWTQVSVIVSQPEEVIINGSNTNPTCFEESNGLIDMSITGGTMPYSCLWTNGSQDQDLTNLSAGTYNVTITDANNCVYNQSFTLTQPNPLSIDLNSPLNFHNHNITMNGGSDGSISVEVDGGTEAYTYLWSNGSTSPSQDNLTAGVYYLTVEDAQGCRIMDTIVLTEPDILELPTIYTPNEDGQNDAFDIHGIEAYPNNILTVVNRWGNVVYEEEKYHNTWKGTHFNGEELPDGVYFIILKINGGEIERNSYVHIKRY